jgi:hypothetical protein
MTPLSFIQTRALTYSIESNINDLILQAEGETSDNYPTSDLRSKAVGLLVCHWIALSKRDSSGAMGVGSIISEREGKLARSYALASVSSKVEVDLDLSQTRWGLELIQHQKKCFFFPRTRML